MPLTLRITLFAFINLLRYDREWVSAIGGLIASTTEVKPLLKQYPAPFTLLVARQIKRITSRLDSGSYE